MSVFNSQSCMSSATCVIGVYVDFTECPGELTNANNVGIVTSHPGNMIYLPGDIQSVECTGGFVLVGNSWRQCRTDGSWSNELPTCRKQKTDIYGKIEQKFLYCMLITTLCIV